jgi:hypothetical protein
MATLTVEEHLIFQVVYCHEAFSVHNYLGKYSYL